MLLNSPCGLAYLSNCVAIKCPFFSELALDIFSLSDTHSSPSRVGPTPDPRLELELLVIPDYWCWRFGAYRLRVTVLCFTKADCVYGQGTVGISEQCDQLISENPLHILVK